jgi:UDP-N-acetylglucosamine 2-epimerase (non-hydrolysing)
MEAGNRCFDFRVPEEINRKIVDHTSDINLPYSDIAREYLLREGIPSDQVITTGSPMREVLDYYINDINTSDILSRLKLSPKKYFLVSSHREENVDNPKNLKKIIDILNGLAKKYNNPIIFSTHPRTKKKLENLGMKTNPHIQFLKPFGFFDYNKLQIDARCVLSDSGTITEESSILNFPALNIREVHERPEGFEQASVIMVGLDVDLIYQSLKILDEQPRGNQRLLDLVDNYAPTNISDKILRIILSYTGFVDRKVWHKDK